jgi:hypothetical protein
MPLQKRVPKAGRRHRRAVVFKAPAVSRWVRGPAWVDGDQIVMDLSLADLYQPLADLRAGLELTKVNTPAEAAAFVQRFGLLRLPDGLPHAFSPSRIPTQARQPFREIQVVAASLRGIVERAALVRRGARGDQEAIARLRTVCCATDDRTVLIANSDLNAAALSSGLHESEGWPLVYDRASIGEPVDPGLLRIGVVPHTLRGVCYLGVVVALCEKEELEICPECGGAFIVEDARQRFCSPKCSSRSRFKKHKASPRFRSRAKKRIGARHGKKAGQG